MERFCTPVHRFSQAQTEISIDHKNKKNYRYARLNRERKSFAAQFIEGAKSRTADAPSFFCASQILIRSGMLEDAPIAL